MNIVIQKLKKDFNDEFLLAEKYYAFLSELNSLNLTTREIQLVAFTAIKGSISNCNAREEFCAIHGTTFPTINNIISKLKKLGVFVKKGKKIMVNPVIVLDFKKNIVLQITLEHDNKGLVD